MAISKANLARELDYSRRLNPLRDAAPVEPGYQPHLCFNKLAQFFCFEIRPDIRATIEAGVDEIDGVFSAVFIVEIPLWFTEIDRNDLYFEAHKDFSSLREAQEALQALPTRAMLSPSFLKCSGWEVSAL